MKKIIIFLSVYFICMSCAFSQHVPNIIYGETSPELSQVDRWVYLVELEGNDYRFLDSCFIKKGISKFRLEGNLQTHGMNMIAFSQSGPVQALIYLMPGEEVHLTIDSDNKMYYPGVGSESQAIYYKTVKETADTRKRLNLLKEEYNKLENDSHEKQSLADSIKYLQQEIDYGIDLRYLPYIKHPGLYHSTVVYGLQKFLHEDEFQRHVAIMKEKFPSDEKIQAYPKNLYAPPESSEGKWAYNRYKEIINNNYSSRGEETSFTTASQPNFEIGQVIRNLEFPDVNGQVISLYDINTDYILVDFWASWCIPCRKETPYLKTALNEFGDILTIFAVTIDSTKEPWLKAIETDESGEFTHVFLGNGEEGKQLFADFGINSIPSNFLIDSDHKIVAVNLRGEQLSEFLANIMETSIK